MIVDPSSQQDFYVACERNCTIDFLPIAIYGTDITKSIGQIVSGTPSLTFGIHSIQRRCLTRFQTEWYDLFGASNGVPIWIVEMDCRDLSTATGCPAEAAEAYARARKFTPPSSDAAGLEPALTLLWPRQ